MAGIGSSSPSASVPPLRRSAPASSSAKNGLPPDVSQIRIRVGRGKVVSRRVLSSRRIAPTLRPLTSIPSQLLLGHGAAQPGRHVSANGDQGGDRFVQAGKRVAERGKRRGVQPLDVV